jgi:hypothetical protein
MNKLIIGTMNKFFMGSFSLYTLIKRDKDFRKFTVVILVSKYTVFGIFREYSVEPKSKRNIYGISKSISISV